MTAQLFGSHVAHGSNGLSGVRINGLLWTGRQKLCETEVHDFRQLASVASHSFLVLNRDGPANGDAHTQSPCKLLVRYQGCGTL